MTEALEMLSSVWNEILKWVLHVWTQFTTVPLLMIFLALYIVGYVVSLFRTLKS